MCEIERNILKTHSPYTTVKHSKYEQLLCMSDYTGTHIV